MMHNPGWLDVVVAVLGAVVVAAGFLPIVKQASWRQLSWQLFGGLLILVALVPITHLKVGSFELERSVQLASATDDKVDALAKATDAELKKQAAEIEALSASSAADRAAAQAKIQSLTQQSLQAAQAFQRSAREAASVRRRLPQVGPDPADTNPVSGPDPVTLPVTEATPPCCSTAPVARNSLGVHEIPVTPVAPPGWRPN